MATNWGKVEQSLKDLKIYNMDAIHPECDGQRSYWHNKRKEPMHSNRRNFSGGFLTIWEAFWKKESGAGVYKLR